MASIQSSSADWPAAVVSLDETLRRLGQRLVSAESDLRMARSCYEALLAASRACLGAGQVRPSSVPLTPQERRVANLVATGMSNREVAQALHVSVHTVKTHVKNVLDKLDIRSRWQMAATVGQLSPMDDSASEFRSAAGDIHPARDIAGRLSKAGSGRGRLQSLRR